VMRGMGRGPRRFRRRFRFGRRWAEAERAGRVALVGNPNVGKSVIFNLLTGRYATVSNYPGTTVEVTRGRARCGRRWLTVVDTPGVNSLTPSSEDERVARDMLLDEGLEAAIVVADAKNLKRALSLVVQLAELEIPLVLDLNMWDEALERGIEIDAGRLSEELGVPVVPTVAIQGKGIERLKGALQRAAIPRVKVDYGPEVEEAVRRWRRSSPKG